MNSSITRCEWFLKYRKSGPLPPTRLYWISSGLTVHAFASLLLQDSKLNQRCVRSSVHESGAASSHNNVVKESLSKGEQDHSAHYNQSVSSHAEGRSCSSNLQDGKAKKHRNAKSYNNTTNVRRTPNQVQQPIARAAGEEGSNSINNNSQKRHEQNRTERITQSSTSIPDVQPSSSQRAVAEASVPGSTKKNKQHKSDSKKAGWKKQPNSVKQRHPRTSSAFVSVEASASSSLPTNPNMQKNDKRKQLGQPSSGDQVQRCASSSDMDEFSPLAGEPAKGNVQKANKQKKLGQSKGPRIARAKEGLVNAIGKQQGNRSKNSKSWRKPSAKLKIDKGSNTPIDMVTLRLQKIKAGLQALSETEQLSTSSSMDPSETDSPEQDSALCSMETVTEPESDQENEFQNLEFGSAFNTTQDETTTSISEVVTSEGVRSSPQITLKQLLERLSFPESEAKEFRRALRRANSTASAQQVSAVCEMFVQAGLRLPSLGSFLREHAAVVATADLAKSQVEEWSSRLPSKHAVCNLISSHPSLLFTAPVLTEADLRTTLDELGVSQQSSRSVLCSAPQLLSCSSEQIYASFAALQQVAQHGGRAEGGQETALQRSPVSVLRVVSEEQARQLALQAVQARPQLMAEDVDSLFQQTVVALSTDLPAEAARDLVADNLLLLTVPPPRIHATLRLFTTAGIKGDELCRVLRACPEVFSKSHDDLEQKIHLLMAVVPAPVENVVAYPRYFGTSFANVIAPRLSFLRSRQPQQLHEYSLVTLINKSDKEFCKRHAMVPLSDYQAFKASWLPNKTSPAAATDSRGSDRESASSINLSTRSPLPY